VGRRILAMQIMELSSGMDIHGVVKFSSLPVEHLIAETFIPYPPEIERTPDVAETEEKLRNKLKLISQDTQKGLHLGNYFICFLTKAEVENWLKSENNLAQYQVRGER
jgi:hypothetical protein